MDLASVADITEALEVRAKRGVHAKSSAAELARLMATRRRIDRGLERLPAIADVLLDAVRRIKTPHIVQDGDHGHTQEALRCYLAIYARLDVAKLLRDGDRAFAKERAFPGLSGSDPDAVASYGTVTAFRPDAKWSPGKKPDRSVTVKDAMTAVLALKPGTVDNRWAPLAPSLLAAELFHGEAELLLPLFSGAACRLGEVEERLAEAGLLAALCDTDYVKKLVRPLKDALAEPLSRYSQAIASFSLVTAQLDTTEHTLQGISISEDLNAKKENDHYVERQLQVLTERGIVIERIFLFREGEEDSMRDIAIEHRDRAQKAKEGSRNTGSYVAYVIPRSVAEDIVDDENFLSLAIFDQGKKTQRVATQLFEKTRKYQVSANSDDISTAAVCFENIKDNRPEGTLVFRTSEDSMQQATH